MDNTAEEMLTKTIFLVEATSYEHSDLWQTFSFESPDRPKHILVRHKWEQENGYWVEVGQLDNMPVCISLMFDKIDGQLVCFWEATSLVVDYRLIEEWFGKYFIGKWDNGTRRATTNAMNFHHCLDAIEEKNFARIVI